MLSRFALRSDATTWLLAAATLVTVSALAGCSCATTSTARDAAAPDAVTPDAGSDAGTDAAASDDVGLDAGGRDAPATCTHPVGERYPAGDACNFCECGADGQETCTVRRCFDSIGGCTYAGVMHAYGERFPSSDQCNECVCAASGLACTVRDSCPDVPVSAILLESMDAPCGTNTAFTPRAVLEGLPVTDFTAPFLYHRERPPNLYPELLPDTTVRVRIVYDDGFLVCRIPSPDQPALDIQIMAELITEDGAFDEGFPAYLRRNDFGFLDAWLVDASAPLGALHGTYTPNCALDPGGYTFGVQVDPDGHASGGVTRICETDILLDVASFDRPAP